MTQNKPIYPYSETCNPRYFFNKDTGGFIQIAGTTIDKPFSNEWIEITKQAFDYLLSLQNGGTS
jgi:hypothetical protein